MLKNYCAMDLHHSHTVIEAQTAAGRVVLHRDVATEPRHIIEAIKAIRGPKGVVIEEGTMTDWAMRVIQPYVSEVIACDPRRNRLISDDGDKSDPIDTGKLIELYRLGALRAVHHPRRQSMMDLRAWLWTYHDQVGLVTAAKNKIKAAFRGAGVQYGPANVYAPAERPRWLAQLPRASVRGRLEVLYGNLDDLQARRESLGRRIGRLARRHVVAKTFLDVPGYGPVRALTFVVVVDTPFRFSTPQKLWRYGGLGRRKAQSGPPERVRLRRDPRYNRRLKDVAEGAATCALALDDDNPFKLVYERLLRNGSKESLARLTVARKMLSVPWGMWKGGVHYDPSLVTRN